MPDTSRPCCSAKRTRPFPAHSISADRSYVRKDSGSSVPNSTGARRSPLPQTRDTRSSASSCGVSVWLRTKKRSAGVCSPVPRSASNLVSALVPRTVKSCSGSGERGSAVRGESGRQARCRPRPRHRSKSRTTACTGGGVQAVEAGGAGGARKRPASGGGRRRTRSRARWRAPCRSAWCWCTGGRGPRRETRGAVLVHVRSGRNARIGWSSLPGGRRPGRNRRPATRASLRNPNDQRCSRTSSVHRPDPGTSPAPAATARTRTRDAARTRAEPFARRHAPSRHLKSALVQGLRHRAKGASIRRAAVDRLAGCPTPLREADPTPGEGPHHPPVQHRHGAPQRRRATTRARRPERALAEHAPAHN